MKMREELATATGSLYKTTLLTVQYAENNANLVLTTKSFSEENFCIVASIIVKSILDRSMAVQTRV